MGSSSRAIDAVGSQLRELLVGRSFLFEVLLEERCAVIATAALPRRPMCVTHDLVTLDRQAARIVPQKTLLLVFGPPLT